jgi:putative ABC transport system ATP-binding protein
MSFALQCTDIGKHYGEGPLAQTVLDGISLKFEPGDACLLLGPSGSGKTTLLSIFGCLLTPSRGQLILDGEPVDFQAHGQLSELRRTRVGFVFQHAQLLPFLTAEENLRVVGRNAGLTESRLSSRIEDLLQALDLASMRGKKPDLLSGGQRQRLAIARAVLHRPAIVLADEPTAALDWPNGQKVADLLLAQARHEGAVLIAVTHDTRLVSRFDRLLSIDNGSVHESPAVN